LVAPEAAACPNCGRPQQAPAIAAQRRTDGQAVASLVLGIIGIGMCPLIASIVAIILGSQAKARIAADPSLEGEGMAKAGVILGWIGVGLGAIGIIFFVLSIAFSVGSGQFG
jgi:hypothetical protein